MNINLPLKKIVEIVEGQCSLDNSFFVKRIAPLETAGPQDVAIIFESEAESVFAPVSAKTIQQSNAGAILARSPVVPGKNYVLVSDPLHAFERLVSHTKEQDNTEIEAPLLHVTALVDPSAMIGKNVRIGPGVVVESGARIGEGSEIGAHAFVGRDCIIGMGVHIYPGVKILERCEVGDQSIIHAGVVIGSDGFGYRITKQGLRKVPQVGIVRIGKHVEIGANTAIDRAAFEVTEIGDGVKIDNLVHISHNVRVGAHTAILAQTAIAGSVTIGMGCQIGGQVAIKDHVVIGNRVKIVGKSGVMKNLPDDVIVAGVPSMPFSQWKRLVVGLTHFFDIVKPLRKTKRGRIITWWKRLWIKRRS